MTPPGEVLNADIMADASRLHMFEEPLAKLGGKAARDAERRIVSESELNVLAKMLQGGADIGEVRKLAAQMGVDMAAVTARQAEVRKLSTDYLAHMLRQGAPEDKVAAMAAEMGVDLAAVKTYMETGANLYRQLQLKMDVLHGQYLDAAGDAAKQAKLAEEMAAIQGKLNAAVPGPYLTPGGAAKHVTHREPKLRPAGPYKAISPALGYTALLDDLYMLDHALHGAGAELTEGQAKALGKYGDRLLVTAGQFGVDFSKGSTKALWEEIGGILARARLEKGRPPLDRLQPMVQSARDALVGQLGELTRAVKKNAEDYLAEAAEPALASGAHAMAERSAKLLARAIFLATRIEIRKALASGEQDQ